MFPKKSDLLEFFSSDFLTQMSKDGWLLIFICIADIAITILFLDWITDKSRFLLYIFSNGGAVAIVIYKLLTTIPPVIFLELQKKQKRNSLAKFCLIGTSISIIMNYILILFPLFVFVSL
ncbi:MAG: hypothetical protein QMD86_02095 [Patescibacteria group bacterium]|nr:hypothetical protein [Patescibacteria group bacterium]